MIRDSAILFFGTMIGSVLNFLFQIFAGRQLGPANYGIFSALLAIVYLVSVITNTVQTDVANVVARYAGADAKGQIKDLAIRSLKKLTLVAFIATIILGVTSPLIASFLHIKTSYVLILAPVVFSLIILPINRGLLQGLQRFKALSLNVSSEGFVKIIFGFIFISVFAWGVNGANLALAAAVSIPFFLAFFSLKSIYAKEIIRKHIDSSELYKYAIPVFLFLLSATLFYTVDIFLVKHFFEESTAGHYSAASLIGRMIYFAVIPLTQVMFSKVSKIKKNNAESRSILKKSLGMVLLVGGGASLLYFIVPGLIVNIMFGADYLVITPIIGLFGIIITIYCIMWTLAMFLLAVRKSKFIAGLIILNILEIGLIWFYHPTLTVILIELLAIASTMVIFLFRIVLSSKDK
jgi:O-antigen/teichoic acid export membrane protein